MRAEQFGARPSEVQGEKNEPGTVFSTATKEPAALAAEGESRMASDSRTLAPRQRDQE